jgi:hypothetical protein
MEVELSDAVGPACGSISPYNDNRIMNCAEPETRGREADETTLLNVSFFVFAMTSSRSF